MQGWRPSSTGRTNTVLRGRDKVQGTFGWYLTWAFGESAGALCLSGFSPPSDGQGGYSIGLSTLELLIVAGYLIIRLRHHFGRMEAEP